jgi:CSLREA domain-containing protein
VPVGEAGGRRVVALLAAALIALACAAALPALAAAEEFKVDSTADESDLAPGSGGCASAAGKCTLRAAIEEADSSVGEFDTVVFDEDLFNGGAAGTVFLTKSLPAISDPLLIKGQCADAAEVLRPCVGIDGPGPTEPALVVSDADETEIEGAAVTGAEIGIRVDSSERVKVFGSWFGVKLDGGLDGNGTGVLLAPESSSGRIGGEGPERRNVFAGNSGEGLHILGASNARVLGNYFGVGPDGTTPAPNGDNDIEVASKSTGSGVAEASGTTIGVQLGTEKAASPTCDGGCNVISGSGSNGIDLEGDPAVGEPPAAFTTIFGNYIGLDASGVEAVPNSGDGVHVGQAAGTVIGGPRNIEANRFAGGDGAVVAGPAANNLVVRGNSIGVAFGGSGLVAPNAGIAVNSEGLSGPTAEAVIAENDLRMEGGLAIAQTGLAGWISGNRIAGAQIGIRVDGVGEEGVGNLIQGNVIEDTTANGILIESSFNEILGNEVRGSGDAGIRIEGTGLFFGNGVGANRVGGDLGRDENLIAGSGGPAIEIVNPANTANEVGRNRGAANAGRFIALVKAAPAEKEGPNKGVKPPTLSVTTGSEATGLDVEAGARIRVFRKAGAEAGEIESFLGEAIANEEGEWILAYDSPLPAGSIVAATQTAEGGTSELATATVPAVPVAAAGSHGCPVSGGCGFGPGPANPRNPQTKIFKGSKGKKFAGAMAAFKFKSSVSGSTFRCRLDGKPFRKCHSPIVYTGLKPGKHVFKVRAVNSAGVADPTPAQAKFAVLG